jgi:hypothetical protein
MGPRAPLRHDDDPLQLDDDDPHLTRCAVRDDIGRVSDRCPRASCPGLSMSLSFVCEARECVDWTLAPPRVRSPNVKSRSAPESYIFQGFSGFRIRSQMRFAR